eukprot:Skav230571  [mRNA]  locus=scaffold971:87859:99568:- [translate_table: standard]
MYSPAWGKGLVKVSDGGVPPQEYEFSRVFGPDDDNQRLFAELQVADITPLPLKGALQEDDIVFDELYIKTQKCRYQICHVRSAEQCLALLHRARRRRTSGVSSQNMDSSRSHAIVHLFVQSPRRDGRAAIGTLTLVDLAGTEKEQENPSEQGRKSARLLNTSLCSLNRLLRKLQAQRCNGSCVGSGNG